MKSLGKSLASAIIVGLTTGILLIAVISPLYLREDYPASTLDAYPASQLPIVDSNNPSKTVQPSNISTSEIFALADRINGPRIPYDVEYTSLFEKPITHKIVLLSRDFDGTDYSGEVAMGQNATLSPYATLVFSNNNAYAVWLSMGFYGYQVHYAVSHNYGATFSNEVNISGTHGRASPPAFLAVNDTYFLVWSDDSSGSNQILLRYSSDAGQTFSQIYNISNSTSNSYSPSIAYANKHLLVSWQEGTFEKSQIMFRQLEFQGTGNTFSVSSMSKPRLISSGSDISQFPKLVSLSDGKYVYVAWISDPILSPFANRDFGFNLPVPPRVANFRSSNDGGHSWNDIINLGNAYNYPILMGADGNTVHVVWYGRTPNPLSIMYRASHDGGYSFDAPYSITNQYPLEPKLVVQSKTVFIGWVVPYTDKFVVSYDGGRTFTNLLRNG